MLLLLLRHAPGGVPGGGAVDIVPDQEFKAEVAATGNNVIPSTQRLVYDHHGVRIIVSQDGRIGEWWSSS